jgi:hypothetical protein
LLLILGLLGAGLVAVGVAGELYIDVQAGKLETQIRKANEDRFLLLSKEAGDAASSAKTAHDEADAVKEETDELTTRLGNAAKQLRILEQDIRTQGPRWRLLERATPEMVKQLAPFAGQKVDLFVCGTRESAQADREMMSTWGRIADILEDKGAKWSVLHGGLSFWDTRPLACEGIEVYVSSRAAHRTEEAAKALSNGFTRTLPPSIDNMLGVVNSDWVLSMIKRGFEAETAPWVLPAKDPDLITVFIGTHPQTEPSKKKVHSNEATH